MKTHKRDGSEHESCPAVRASDDATESRLVLLALLDALRRIKYACNVVVHTECTYIAAAINQMWPAVWRENSWMTARGQQAKDRVLWENILIELEEAGHILKAVPGKHEFSNWVRCNLPYLEAGKAAFSEVVPKELDLVSDRM